MSIFPLKGLWSSSLDDKNVASNRPLDMPDYKQTELQNIFCWTLTIVWPWAVNFHHRQMQLWCIFVNHVGGEKCVDRRLVWDNRLAAVAQSWAPIAFASVSLFHPLRLLCLPLKSGHIQVLAGLQLEDKVVSQMKPTQNKHDNVLCRFPNYETLLWWLHWSKKGKGDITSSGFF